MKLVVDTNIIFSLFKSDSFTTRLLKERNIELFSPQSLIKELDKYCDLICSKGKIPKESFEEVKKSILEIVKIIPESKELLSKADKLISHKTDVPFLALALELEIPIWSNDPHFKEQDCVRVFTTNELIKEFGLSKF